MGPFEQLVDWIGSAENWSGPAGVPTRVLEHVSISVTAVAIALLIALPIGLAIGHTGRFRFLAVSIANIGRAIPSFAILSITFQLILTFAPEIAFGFVPTVVALTLLAIPPILTNTYVGVEEVDPDLVEAARGMGLKGSQILAGVEIPLAIPLILAGIRTAAVQVVATATLAAVIAGGGLGRYIIDGNAQGDEGMLIAGAVLVALLAILTEVIFGGIQRVLSPRTLSRPTRPTAAEVSPPPPQAWPTGPAGG
jgi:osmoprotectant transport system permease protein